MNMILLGMPLLVRGKILRILFLRPFSINLTFPETFLVPMHMFSLPRNTFPTSNRSYLINIIKIVIIIFRIKVGPTFFPCGKSRHSLLLKHSEDEKAEKSEKYCFAKFSSINIQIESLNNIDT